MRTALLLFSTALLATACSKTPSDDAAVALPHRAAAPIPGVPSGPQGPTVGQQTAQLLGREHLARFPEVRAKLGELGNAVRTGKMTADQAATARLEFLKQFRADHEAEVRANGGQGAAVPKP